MQTEQLEGRRRAQRASRGSRRIPEQGYVSPAQYGYRQLVSLRLFVFPVFRKGSLFQGPGPYRDLFYFLGPYLFFRIPIFSIVFKFTQRLSIQSAYMQLSENLYCLVIHTILQILHLKVLSPPSPELPGVMHSKDMWRRIWRRRIFKVEAMHGAAEGRPGQSWVLELRFPE